MPRPPVPAGLGTHRRSILQVIGLVCVLAGFAGAARGQLLRTAFWDVHPASGALALPCPTTITACEQTVQGTPETGLVSFDFYVRRIGPPWPYPDSTLVGVELNLIWPETWDFVSWTPCGLAYTSDDIRDGSAQLALSWPAPPVLRDSMYLAARVFMNVGGYGRLETTPGSRLLTGSPVTPHEIELEWTAAVAGGPCSYLAPGCGYDGWNSYAFTPLVVVFELAPGDQDTQTVRVTNDCWLGSLCSIILHPSEPWIHVSGEGPWEDAIDVQVTVDATGLAPGSYRGLVEAHVGCAEVLLHVAEVSPAVPSTWGRVKARYREVDR